jgi:integrase
MAKRANGEGSAAMRRPDGRWESRISYRDELGTLRRRSFYADTEREVLAKRKAGLARVDRGAPAVDARTPLAEWVAEWSRTTLEASSRKPATKSLYRMLARVHLTPAPLGTLPLAKIRPQHVDALTLRMREPLYGPKTDKPLSDSTVRTTYTVLRAVLDAAVGAGLIADNPAAKVTRPAVRSRADGRDEARHFTPAEFSAVLAATEGARYRPVFSLLAVTGLRRGEALATRWEDVDLDGGVLRVTGTLSRVGRSLVRTQPKTAKSRRTVPLAPGIVVMLRRHRAAQREEKMRAGSQWTDSGYLFTTELGNPVEPRNLLRAFKATVKAAGVDQSGVGLHTLRHSAATTMLHGGTPIHVVSRILGHSSVAITGDIYGHADDSRQREAMDTLSAALGF